MTIERYVLSSRNEHLSKSFGERKYTETNMENHRKSAGREVRTEKRQTGEKLPSTRSTACACDDKRCRGLARPTPLERPGPPITCRGAATGRGARSHSAEKRGKTETPAPRKGEAERRPNA